MDTVYFSEQQKWRQWLQQNWQSAREIWLIYPKKHSGKPRISYNDAVEEALCFGWIDSNLKSIDSDHSAQKFCPRNPKSSFSQANIERLRWLNENGKLEPVIKKSVKEIIEKKFVSPKDIIDQIQRDELTWTNYQQFGEAYRRIRIAYIAGARKRPEEFQKRLNNFIKKTRQNKLIKGHGGIDKYY